MKKEINYLMNQLLNYGVKTKLIAELDRVYCANLLIDLFHLSSFEIENTEEIDIYTLLDDLCDYAYNNSIIKHNDITTYDLFQARIMGLLMPKPSVVEKEFFRLYAQDKISATQYFYNMAIASNYIRLNRIKKNICFTHSCAYGTLDITINLSKPEKDPKRIAEEKSLPNAGYPKCAICLENMGFSGNLKQEARQNLRVIPIHLDGEPYFLQYSPYSYYNEHAIIFNQKHIPMKIDKDVFSKLLEFVDQFEHYFIGSNADLPIVGGSILSHDHFQGGNYCFPMFLAEKIKTYSLKDYKDIRLEYLNWPLEVLCIKGANKASILNLAEQILQGWIGYNQENINIISHTKDIRHNTITPIVRKINREYEVYLTLRNNKTSSKFPDGIFHPNPKLHHIKKENIGLIEVMGLAVLPKRLKQELDGLKEVLLGRCSKMDLDQEPLLKHKNWALTLLEKYSFTEENVTPILQQELGESFKVILEDCGVFKYGNRIVEMDRFLITLKLIA